MTRVFTKARQLQPWSLGVIGVPGTEGCLTISHDGFRCLRRGTSLRLTQDSLVTAREDAGFPWEAAAMRRSISEV
jgi:hypothetical protein